MASTKQASSETSSEESNQLEKHNDDTTGTGRSYECTFCKRGFTNAQALGGHMNIHRKDKAKAKQVTNESPSLPNKSHEDYLPSRYVPRYYVGNLGRTHLNYQMYFPEPNPSFSHAYDPSHVSENLGFSSSVHEGDGTANLSLGIGIQHGGEEEEKDGDEKGNGTENNEVDLELRLGQNP